MALAAVSLDDKYESESGRVYLNGAQAIVRLALLQRLRDERAGLNTAGFVTGYRGSPVHTVDKEMWRAARFLAARHIHFLPGVNEDLAATSIWGSQQATMFPDAKYDGVFAIWYGKGPGLDRSLDAMRHANLAGTAPHGGVLAMAGDDHAMKSSDVPATCEPTFTDLLMPVLYPANVQEILDYGLYGWALSRYCGAWVGFKIVFETIDASASVYADPYRVEIALPEHFEMPPDGVNIRFPDPWVEQEPRLRRYKIEAAKAFARVNRLNHTTLASPRPRFGIIASGKAWLDVRQAMRELGLTDEVAADLGITVFKVAMPHPLEIDSVFEFRERARGDPGGRGEAPHHRASDQGCGLCPAGSAAPAHRRAVMTRTGTSCCPSWATSRPRTWPARSRSGSPISTLASGSTPGSPSSRPRPARRPRACRSS